MDFSRPALEAYGFTGFSTIAALSAYGGCGEIPKQMGVYAVTRASSDEPAFLEQSTGGHFKGNDPTLPVEELKRNWIIGAFVVYIGKAGGSGIDATLRSRLKLYMDYGSGKPVGHQGGRMIWQLADSVGLLVAWKPLVGVEPLAIEQDLLDDFANQYGRLPFANRRR